MPFASRSKAAGAKYAANGRTLRRYSGVATTSMRSSDGTETRSWAIRWSRARIDLASGRHPALVLLGQPLPADVEDRVGIEAVEGPQADHRVVPLPAER